MTQDSTRAAVLQIDGEWFRATKPVHEFVAYEPGEVRDVLTAVENAATEGHHAVGFVAYEAGRAFGIDGHEPVAGLPLAAFVIYEGLERFDARELREAARCAPALEWQPSLEEEAYAAAVRRIREHVAAGDTYQVNLTFPLRAAFEGDPFALFARLARAQRSTCAAFLDFERWAICSASPELFFARDGDRVTMRPMKGTAARGRTLAEDRRRAAALRRSAKERAENLMIVDMVRNDLGRLAHPGSVRVPELFAVERYPTVLQMTSTVEAQVTAGLADLFAATFPCASVTGAPKIRTAELIRELEGGARGVYTGAVGYVGPGGKARFNVAIRTVTVDRTRGEATYNVGSGVVWDSRPGREYAECLAKARVLEANAEPFSLLETLRWEPGEGYRLLARHLQRLMNSARYFGITCDRGRVRRALEEAVQGEKPLRVRLLVDEDGTPHVETSPLPAAATGPVRVGLAAQPIDPSDVFLYHKTTRREVYDAAMASRQDCDQVLLWTPEGFVTETNIANVAVERGGRWVTPPLGEGLLPGTLRAELLARGEIEEGRVSIDEVAGGARLAVFNSLRGWHDATFVK